jgi:predicted deacetylase
MPPTPRRLLLASIHDVSPRFEGEIDALMDALESHVGKRVAMLVVPNHWGDAPIVPGSPFATRLRRWAEHGIEMFLHGFYHRDLGEHGRPADALRARFMTAGEGEFLGLSRNEATDRINHGRALVEDVIGQKVKGFIAPAWLYGSGAIDALHELSIPIAEDHFKVWSPVTGQRLASGPVITWASRTRARLLSSLAAAAALRHAPLKVLRIGVHPPDVRHPALLDSIDRTFRTAGRRRTAGRYSDLIQCRNSD